MALLKQTRVAIILALVAVIGVAGFSWSKWGESQVSGAASINSLAVQNRYVGVSSLTKLLKQRGMAYHPFSSFSYGTSNHQPNGIVIHETATPDATAWDEAQYFNNNWASSETYVHAIVDDKQVIQLMSPKLGVWGAGPVANSRFIQVELAEVNTRDKFAKSVNNDAIYIAGLLHQYNLKPIRATSQNASTATIWTHNAVSNILGGTDHTDPIGYFHRWDYSMGEFFDLIVHYYNQQSGTTNDAGNSSSSSQASTNAKTSTSSNKQASSQSQKPLPPLPQGHSRRLVHADYLYNSAGNVTSTNKASGSEVTVYGTRMFAGRKFYQVSRYRYIVAYNLDDQLRRLGHAAYVYQANGHNTGTLKSAGSQVHAYDSLTLRGRKFYQIGNNRYVVATNIDGNERRLKSNAYLYKANGRRYGRQILRRQTIARTYGSRVKLHGKYYYQLFPYALVKAANFY
ncbi:MAG: SLAP domain-containing protein [Lactobacillus sp.]|nr:SLAP domain-containing protein [Lactobacillus sp.]